MYFLSNLVLHLPYPIAEQIIDHLADKPSLYLTNVFAGQTPFSLAGAKSHKICGLCPFMKNVTGGFAIVSHRETLSVSFSADVAKCSDTKEIVRIFEENMEKIINGWEKDIK